MRQLSVLDCQITVPFGYRRFPTVELFAVNNPYSAVWLSLSSTKPIAYDGHIQAATPALQPPWAKIEPQNHHFIMLVSHK
jgi:hypothetical protein